MSIEEIEFKIDHNSPIPLHIQVENLLRDLIKLPEYKNGKFLPKEVDLSKRLGISRNTIRQATNKLKNENLLVGKKGVGTRTLKNTVSTKLANWTSFSSEMNTQGMESINYRITAEWVFATQEVADKLRIQAGKEVLRLERVRGTKEGPFVWFISYFHPRIGLTGKEDFSRHLYEILEKDYATLPQVSQEQINAIEASEKVARELNVSKGSPVLLRKRLVLDPGDRPIEYNLGYYRGDSFTYEIDVNR